MTCCALLFAALAGVLALSSRADADTDLGKFTLNPASGKISDSPMATSATSSTGCAGMTAPGNVLLRVIVEGSGVPAGYALALSTEKVEAGTAPFTVDLKSAGSGSLQAALGTAPYDGTYTLALTCGTSPSADRFLAKIRVSGDTWTLLEQQATTLELNASTDVPVNGDVKLTATVRPADAAGTVEFKRGETALGTAEVTGGTAEKTVKAPAVGGATSYTATFTPADPDAYSGAQDDVGTQTGYVVSAKDADGDPLGAKPTLHIGETVKVTVQGFEPGARAAVNVTNSNATFEDVTAGPDGTITDYAFTVPDGLSNDEHDLRFSLGGNSANFSFVSTDEVEESPDPAEPADLDVTDEDGTALDANPNLRPGQTVRITARGYTAEATVEVTLADSEETFEDAEANGDGTVEEYEFTVPEKIEDGDHVLTLAEDKADGHSVAFAFTTGEEPGESPEPSGSETTPGDTGGTDNGGTDGGGTGTGGSTGGGTGGTGGTGTGGSMASTGAQAGAVGLTALALLCAGSALVIHMRRKGLLAFGGDTPQHR
ncbi:hypothetical protein GCM10017589_04150 [Streptomyces poonensis]|nr:hypothetical protein GCM10017589_04150 [Streptomyces poonensis]